MVKLSEVVHFLNKKLSVRKIKDDSRNGLQVRAGNKVKKIGFAVDACMQVFEKAVGQKTDLLVVHHGLLWKGWKNPLLKKRIAFLQKNKVSLYAVHLPLDLHSEYGNAVQLANLIGLTELKKFGEYHGVKVGYYGVLPKSLPLSSFNKSLCSKLNCISRVFAFGPKTIKRVGIVTGGGGSCILSCSNKKIDLFVTGEFTHSYYHYARELGVNVIAAGHYATETLGVKALAELLEKKFGAATVFIDNSTKL